MLFLVDAPQENKTYIIMIRMKVHDDSCDKITDVYVSNTINLVMNILHIRVGW